MDHRGIKEQLSKSEVPTEEVQRQGVIQNMAFSENHVLFVFNIKLEHRDS